VVETLDWLEATGWRAQEASGGPPDWAGNSGLAVEYARGESRISIARDRGQWLMDIRPAGWKRSVDLGIIRDTIQGRKDWSGPMPLPLPEQLPPGVVWRIELPVALEWLVESPDREQLLRKMQLKRSRSLFPSGRGLPSS
jgi:hypothetical protein